MFIIGVVFLALSLIVLGAGAVIWIKTGNEHDRLQTVRADAVTAQADLRDKQNTYADQLEKLKAEYLANVGQAKMTWERAASVRRQRDSLESQCHVREVGALKSTISGLHEEINALENTIGSLREQATADRQEASLHRAQLSKLRQEKLEAGDVVSLLSDERKAIRREIDRLQEEVKSLDSRIEKERVLLSVEEKMQTVWKTAGDAYEEIQKCFPVLLEMVKQRPTETLLAQAYLLNDRLTKLYQGVGQLQAAVEVPVPHYEPSPITVEPALPELGVVCGWYYCRRYGHVDAGCCRTDDYVYDPEDEIDSDVDDYDDELEVDEEDRSPGDYEDTDDDDLDDEDFDDDFYEDDLDGDDFDNDLDDVAY